MLIQYHHTNINKSLDSSYHLHIMPLKMQMYSNFGFRMNLYYRVLYMGLYEYIKLILDAFPSLDENVVQPPSICFVCYTFLRKLHFMAKIVRCMKLLYLATTGDRGESYATLFFI